MSEHHSISRPQASQQADIDELAAAFDRRIKRLSNNGGAFNGSTKFVNTMLSVLALLVASAICGEVVVYGQVQVLQSTVNMLVNGQISRGGPK